MCFVLELSCQLAQKPAEVSMHTENLPNTTTHEHMLDSQWLPKAHTLLTQQQHKDQPAFIGGSLPATHKHNTHNQHRPCMMLNE